MPHLLNVWPAVSRRIRGAGAALVLFDFDGTLAPIAARPELAGLAPETKRLLASLSRREKYVAGVISGRSMDDVAARAGVPGMIYAGNHGLEMSGPGVSFVHPQAARAGKPLAHALRELEGAMRGLPGVIIEDKGLTLSVHYRLAPEDLTGEIRRRFREALSPFLASGRLKTTRGKMALEVRPNLEWGKGKAIGELQRTFPEASLTLFFGDDVTDEDGFAAAQAGGGIAVFVGGARQPTRALHRLDSPAEVTEALALIDQL